MRIPFLTATWRNLIFVNYEVDPKLLEPYLPRGTEIDIFQGKALLSIVAFYFDRNKFLGKLPTYPAASFEEINLRFYVLRKEQNTVKRGVVFIKEVVPSRIIALTARFVYNEPYERWSTARADDHFDPVRGGTLSYEFRGNKERYSIAAKTMGPLRELVSGSLEEFILEHYWGYTRQSYGFSEYEVTHPRWQYWEVRDCGVSQNLALFYGEALSSTLNQRPVSVFVATGSDVTVQWGKRGYTHSRGWVLYDGRCGFCSNLISFWKPTLVKAGFDCAPLQATWVAEKTKLTPKEISDDIRLLLADGTLISGAAVYRYLMKKIWWWAPLGYLCELPGFAWLMERGYRLINKNRLRISRACRLKPDIL